MHHNTTIRRYTDTVLSVALLSFIIIFTGCAALSSKAGGNGEAALRNRVTQYYEAVIAQDWNQVYTIHDNAFQRSISQPVFSSRARSTLITGYEIKTITFHESGDSADVFVEAEISVRGYTFKGVPQKSIWMMEKGKWVRLAQPPGEEMKNPFDQPGESR